MGLLPNQAITKENVVNNIRKNLSIAFPADDAYEFLVDTINYATTLRDLVPLFRAVPSGNLEALTASTRRIREADDTSNTNPTGVNAITKRQIPYSVKKVFWDEWLENDDVFYNAVRRAQALLRQPEIAGSTDLETLVVQILQKAFALDLQDLIFNGDTAYPTGQTDSNFLRILDGFVKTMVTSTNVTDLTTNAPTLADFINHIQMLPEKYKNNFEEDITWFMNRNTHDKIVSLVQARATGYGDVVLQEGRISRLAGYSVDVVAGLQGPLNTAGVPADGHEGFVALTPRRNLVPVFTRDLTYRRTGEGALALKKDSTYHIIHAFLDAVVLEVDAVAYMLGENL